jgi:hypothetical protein
VLLVGFAIPTTAKKSLYQIFFRFFKNLYLLFNKKFIIMAKTIKKRDYNGSDSGMLTSLAVIMGAAVENKTFLFSKRSNWNDAYFKSLNDEIKRVFKEVLGVSGLGDQVKASKDL